MPGSWKSKKEVIGLDFGTAGFKIIQGGWNGEVWTARNAAFASVPAALPKDKDERIKLLKERLAGALGNGSFTGREVVSSLSASVWQCKSLRLPPMPTNELQTAVEWEAADRLNLGSDHYVQFYDAGEVQQGEDVKREVIVLTTSHEAVDEHVQVLAGCGLTPTAIDVAPSALAFAVAHQDNDAAADQATQFTLDIGAQSSSVVISRRGRVLFFKSIAIGVHQFDQAIADALKIPLEEASQLRTQSGTAMDATSGDTTGQAVQDAMRPVISELARETALCMRYYSVTFRGYRPDALVLTGGGAHSFAIHERMAQDVGMEVVPFDKLTQFDFSSIDGRASTLASSCWTVAAGLALRPTVQQTKRGAA